MAKRRKSSKSHKAARSAKASKSRKAKKTKKVPTQAVKNLQSRMTGAYNAIGQLAGRVGSVEKAVVRLEKHETEKKRYVRHSAPGGIAEFND